MTGRRSSAGRKPAIQPSRLVILLVAALVALGSRPATSARQFPDAGSRDPSTAYDRVDDEDEVLDEDGIVLTWRLPANGREVRLESPWLELELRNLDPVNYDVQLRVLEDAGSMQSRRIADPIRAVLAARNSLKLQWPFAAGLPAQLTHSGMVVAIVTACPLDGSRCISGTPEPLFFHPDRGGYVVYDELLLCRRYNCGALTGRVAREPGTWRVMGGGPLHRVVPHEEPEADDDGIVDGGDL